MPKSGNPNQPMRKTAQDVTKPPFEPGDLVMTRFSRTSTNIHVGVEDLGETWGGWHEYKCLCGRTYEMSTLKGSVLEKHFPEPTCKRCVALTEQGKNPYA